MKGRIVDAARTACGDSETRTVERGSGAEKWSNFRIATIRAERERVDDKKAEYVALDQANSAAQAKAFERLQSAKVVILPNADHFVFFSNEQEVEKDMKDFLATLKTEGN